MLSVLWLASTCHCPKQSTQVALIPICNTQMRKVAGSHHICAHTRYQIVRSPTKGLRDVNIMRPRIRAFQLSSLTPIWQAKDATARWTKIDRSAFVTHIFGNFRGTRYCTLGNLGNLTHLNKHAEESNQGTQTRAWFLRNPRVAQAVQPGAGKNAPSSDARSP